MNDDRAQASRGRTWFHALTGGQAGLADGGPKTVLRAEAPLGGEQALFLAVVPDPENRFPRARGGEVGLAEGWALARHLHEIVAADAGLERPRPIVAVVDVTSQAYGRTEEMLGIHLACAAAVDAYASARLAGHPVVALLVGRAMSGAFLAHGYQANRILALDDAGVLVHAMGKQAAARVTRRSLAEVEALGRKVLPMSYDIRACAQLGILHKLIEGVNADQPSPEDLRRTEAELAAAVADARSGPADLSSRLTSEAARTTRAASIEARRRLAAQWAEG